MNKGSIRQLISAVLIEHSLWLVPAAIYLWYCITKFDIQSSIVFPHLKLVFGFALAFTALRAISSGRFSSILAVAHTTALVGLLSFYMACVVGYSYWGGLPTTQMLGPYLAHSGDFLRTLQISPVFVVVSLLFFVACSYTVTAFVHRRSSSIVTFPRQLSLVTRTVVFFTGISLAFFSYIDLTILRYQSQMEPITQVFGNTNANNHRAWSPRVQTDKIALDARESYLQNKPTINGISRNVVLIVGDALRPSRMSLFGAARNTTPELEKLANSVPNSYLNTITASCAESFCGLISLSRSRYAHDVSKNDLTISDVLSRHGYQTDFVLGGDHTNFYGLKDWFGETSSYWDGALADVYANDDRSVIRQLKSLPLSEDKPQFLQIHLMSTHALGTREESSKKWTPVHNYYTTPGFGIGSTKRTTAVRNYYDNGMFQFDKNVKNALDTLEAKGFLRDALVIITGDHGEMLGEHNLYSHANGVYQQVLEVPLMMFRFGHTGPIYEENPNAGQIDIGPTILTELGLPIPSRWIGNALDELGNRRFVHFEHKNEFGLIDFSIPNKKWKYWMNRNNGAEFAFELNSDPGEVNNQITSIKPSLRALWRDELEPSIASIPLR